MASIKSFLCNSGDIVTDYSLLDIDGIYNESDVEQKIVYPLLVSPRPCGLEINTVNIKTKPSIKPLEIGKRKNKRIYFPDYLIIEKGFPLLIVEAKPPSGDVTEGYREARLYATEINAMYPHGINPATRIICSNGKITIAGFWDSDTPKHSITLEEMNSANVAFFNLLEEFKFETLQTETTKFQLHFKPKSFLNPVKMLGGLSVRDEELGNNSFGNIIALDYQHLFNPNTPKQREFIVKNAYIKSKSRERYVQPIDKVVRAAIPPSVANSKLIYSSETDKIADQLSKRLPNNLKDAVSNDEDATLEHQILMLIGDVGSGKSTFVDYLRYKALPPKLTKKTFWIRVDMNDAPLNQEMLYSWICEQIIKDFQRLHSDFDFFDYDNQQKIYSVEIGKIKKGPIKIFEGTDQHRNKLYEEMKSWLTDKS